MTLTDSSEVTKASAFSEIGATGLRHYGGVLDEELVPQLAGDRAVRVYGEMAANEPIVGGVLMAIDNLVRRVEWEVEPAEDTGEGRRWAEHVESCLDDMSSSWSDHIAEFFSMLPYGFSYHEVVHKRRRGERSRGKLDTASSKYDDGLVGWRKMPIRSQDSKTRWDFDAAGGVQGMWQLVQGANEEKLIPLDRALLFRPGSHKGSPEGHSILRTAYRPWWFKRRIEELEGIGVERDLAGLPVAHVPARMLTTSATADERRTVQAIKDIVTSIRRNAEEGAVWPSEWDSRGNELYRLELLSSGSRRQFDTGPIIARKSQEIAICALADWLLLGHEAVGSKALSTSKIDIFLDALETWTNGVAAVLTAHAVPRLMSLNGVSRDLSPIIKPTRVHRVDLSEFATTLATLVTAGLVTPDDDLEDHAREVVQAPPRSATGERAQPQQPLEQPEPVDEFAEQPLGSPLPA